ncbi:hypothetical protein [Flaviflexus ciconiae]|nr:hypothetical protein [Flaviflexus ciconiae]
MKRKTSMILVAEDEAIDPSPTQHRPGRVTYPDRGEAEGNSMRIMTD